MDITTAEHVIETRIQTAAAVPPDAPEGTAFSATIQDGRAVIAYASTEGGSVLTVPVEHLCYLSTFVAALVPAPVEEPPAEEPAPEAPVEEPTEESPEAPVEEADPEAV